MNKKARKPAKPDTSPQVAQRDKIDFDLKIREFNWSENQKSLIQKIQSKETKYIFVQGPAGSAKTHLAVYTALQAMNERRIGEIVYVRQPVESSRHNIGFLKGDIQDKLTPYAQPLKDKLNEFLPNSQITRLEDEERIICAPVGHMRGRTFNANYVIVDEAQNLSSEDFLLIMTRLGKFSKMIIAGDIMQPDVNNSAFQKVACLFDDERSREKGVEVVTFGKEDIFRNEILSFIIEKFESFS
jgi:phosphate starvation-inducible PhoH-like protein